MSQKNTSRMAVKVRPLDAWREPGGMRVAFRVLASRELSTFLPLRARFNDMTLPVS